MFYNIPSKNTAIVIPDGIWFEIFKKKFPDSFTPWQDMSFEELKHQLPYVSKANQEKAWLAIILMHPTLDNQQIMEIGEHLGISVSEQLNLAVMLDDSPTHLNLLKKLYQKESYSQHHFNHYCLRIERAARCGHLTTLKLIISNLESYKAYFIGIVESFKGFSVLSLKDSLRKITASFTTSNKLNAILVNEQYSAFTKAAENGHVEVLNYFAKKVPEQLQEMIAADNYSPFQKAAKKGQLNVLDYLAEQASEQLQEMVAADTYSFFGKAAGKGYLNVLNYFAEQHPEHLQEMIAAGNYSAFWRAAKKGQLEVLQYLLEKISAEKKQEMLEKVSYSFLRAAENGHLNVVEYLVEKTPKFLKEIHFIYAFRGALKNNHELVVYYLLNHPTIFAQNERYLNEAYVRSFVTQKLLILRAQKQEGESSNSDQFFDVTSSDEAKLLFYVARNLIRRNTAYHDLQFLLNIPAVKALVHTEVTPNKPNELLRLASTVGNKTAAQLLLSIPEVEKLAQQNDYYHNEDHNNLDLRTLTTNPPSAPENHHIIEAYEELIHSIPDSERENIINELDNNSVTERANSLCEELASNKPISLKKRGSRTLFLAALRNLRENKISVNQLATLHILDSAIHTLYKNPINYSLLYQALDNKGALIQYISVFEVLNELRRSTIQSYAYNAVPPFDKSISISDLTSEMQKPLMQLFFNFNVTEWQEFCLEVSRVSSSEQFFHVLVPPVGCWSSIVFRIQEIMQCMRVLDWCIRTEEGDLETQNIMLVPSFSMFQAAINVKAKTLGRKPVELTPTYGYIEAEHYAHLKSVGKIAMAMYLPESDYSERYQFEQGTYRTKIDGHSKETAFCGAIHDVYHAMREISMSENIAMARMRLAAIAKQHPKNQLNSSSRPIDDLLIDGELIYSYPPEQDTMFDSNYRPANAQIFGDLFYCPALTDKLDPDLKRAFIEDMVINKEEWKKDYHLDRADLRREDQIIYDEIETKQKQVTSIFARTIKRISFWVTHPQKETNPISPATPCNTFTYN